MRLLFLNVRQKYGKSNTILIYTFAQLRPFPNLVASYKHGNIKTSIRITLKK